MTDETEANAVADGSQSAVTTGAQQSETLYSDKRGNANQASSNESDQDIGADEALAASIVETLTSWQANKKRTYDRTEENLQSAYDSAHGSANRTAVIAETALMNLVVRANDQNTSRQTYHDKSVDNLLNINEQDAAGVSLAAVVAQMVSEARRAQAASEM